MNDNDKDDMKNWLWHVWLSKITDEKQKDELLKDFEKGDIESMYSGLSIRFENERLKGKNEGIAETEKKARKEKIEMAKKLKKRGIPIEYILEDTGLTIDEIEK